MVRCVRSLVGFASVVLLLFTHSGCVSLSHRGQHDVRVRRDLLGGDGEFGGEVRARPRPPNVPVHYEKYVVVRGDSFWQIAHKHGVPLGELLAANGMAKDDVLHIGQELHIPVRQAPAGGEFYVIQKGDTLFGLSRRWGCTVDDIRQRNDIAGNTLIVGRRLLLPKSTATSPAARQPDSGNYTIRRGDTLSSIAVAHGVSAKELASLNGIGEPNRIREGQTLRIPAGGQPTNVRASSPTPTSRPAQQSTRSDDDLFNFFDDLTLYDVGY